MSASSANFFSYFFSSESIITPTSDVTIPEEEQDAQLSKKIIDAELSGVFNWVLAGLKRLLEQKKFTDSQKVRDALNKYEKESDSVRLFIDEMGYKPSVHGSIPITASNPSVYCLYSEYRSFCVDSGHNPVNAINFKKRLVNAGIDVRRRNTGWVAFLSKILDD